MTESLEPRGHEQGMEISEGDQPINLAKIRIALDLDHGNGRFSRKGLSWFVQLLFLKDQAQTPDELNLTLNGYYSYASEILNSSVLAAGLDIYTEEGGSEFENRLLLRKNSSEWWAAWLVKEINSLIDNPKIEDKEVQRALWEMNKLTSFHSMLMFTQMLEPTIWSGYMVNNLKSILKIWDDNKENHKEEFWQKVFGENHIILSQVFSFPVIFMEGTVCVGGTNLKNKGANLVDFLLKNNLTKNTALVEIKTPKTKILGSPYRALYNISPEITGAIIQISNYKDSLIKNCRSLIEDIEEEEKINAFNPQCIIIAGNAEAELKNPKQIKSFELYRNGLKDVQLITYDELFHKIKILIELIEGKDTAFS